MASITSSLGIGSGIDIGSLVTQLVDAEKKPTVDKLTAEKTKYDAIISSYGKLKSAATTLQSKATGLSTLSSFRQKSATSSADTILTGTAGTAALNGSYNVVVSAIAKSHSLATSATYTATTDTVGTGTLTFKFGTTVYDSGTDTYTSFTQNTTSATKTVTIDSTNNTLAGVRDAINNASIGVTASIVYTGSVYKLAISSASTGAANSLEMTVTGDGDGNNTNNSGLSVLAFNSAATNLDQTQAANDAALTINGLALTSASNTVTEAITGLTLNLKKADAATTATLTVADDSSAIKTKINDLVTAYNSWITEYKTQAGYDSTSATTGVLNGDFTALGLDRKNHSIVSRPVNGLTTTLKALADIGVTSKKKDDGTFDGTLVVDDTKLSAAISSSFSQFAGLFSAYGAPTDAQISFITNTSSTVVGNYAVNVTTMATRGIFTGAGGLTFPVTIAAASDNDNFQLNVDGIDSGTITLTAGTYNTGALMAAEMQRQINGDSALKAAAKSVTVAYNSGTQGFEITSASYGSTSAVNVLAVDTNVATTLGLTVANGTAGVNVAGTIGGETATGSGQVLTGAGTNTTGLGIKVTGGATGARGTINFTRGVADQLNTHITQYTKTSSGAIDSRTKELSTKKKRIDTDMIALNKRMTSLSQRLTKQFIAMDMIVGRFNSTASYLEQQFAALDGSNN